MTSAKRALILAILMIHTGADAQSLTQGIRSGTYNVLLSLKQKINLTDDEFGALLASNQQMELAATTAAPNPEQIANFGHIQALSNRCGMQVLTRLKRLPPNSVSFPNMLDTADRRRAFLAFTSKVQMRKAETELQNLTPDQACAQAAALVMK